MGLMLNLLQQMHTASSIPVQPLKRQAELLAAAKAELGKSFPYTGQTFKREISNEEISQGLRSAL